MTKPSREDFEREREKWLHTTEPVSEPIVLEALRIAADQMTEREKVVAYINALIEALPPIYDGERKILSRVVMDIERGDHSTATPVSGWRSMDSAPRDGSEFMASVTVDGLADAWVWEPRSRFNPEADRFEIWSRTDYDQDGWEFYPSLTFRSWMPQPLPSPPGGGT